MAWWTALFSSGGSQQGSGGGGNGLANLTSAALSPLDRLFNRNLYERELQAAQASATSQRAHELAMADQRRKLIIAGAAFVVVLIIAIVVWRKTRTK